MSQKEDEIWEGKTVAIYLSTPLVSENKGHADVFMIHAKVEKQVGSGLMLHIEKLLDQERKETTLKTQKIFLPFSKVDYIAL